MACPFQGLQRSQKRLYCGPSGAPVWLRLCVVFLDKGMPLPAKHALIRSHTGALSITELTAWTTSVLTGEAIFRQSMDTETANRKQPARLR